VKGGRRRRNGAPSLESATEGGGVKVKKKEVESERKETFSLAFGSRQESLSPSSERESLFPFVPSTTMMMLHRCCCQEKKRHRRPLSSVRLCVPFLVSEARYHQGGTIERSGKDREALESPRRGRESERKKKKAIDRRFPSFTPIKIAPPLTAFPSAVAFSSAAVHSASELMITAAPPISGFWFFWLKKRRGQRKKSWREKRRAKKEAEK
jgi:hypothetical protein